MQPGEGGPGAPSLPGRGQTCLESQGGTRSSNPPTRSHLTQPAAAPLLRAPPPSRPPRGSRLPARPTSHSLGSRGAEGAGSTHRQAVRSAGASGRRDPVHAPS